MVKELVENAIDAGARASHAWTCKRRAARQLIRVTDDGDRHDRGRGRPGARCATPRPSSRRDADLDAIATLGFRGEALPAICAVTRFAVRSSPARRVEHGHPRARRGRRGQREAARGRARGHHGRGPGPLLQHAGAAQVPQERADRAGGGAPAPRGHRAGPSRTSTSASPTTARPSSPRRARAACATGVGALWGFELAARMLDVDRREGGRHA